MFLRMYTLTLKFIDTEDIKSYNGYLVSINSKCPTLPPKGNIIYAIVIIFNSDLPTFKTSSP